MLCKNTPHILNALEEKILETVSTDTLHVGIVGAGDGRLARSMQEKCGKKLKISLIEPCSQLHRYLDDFKNLGGQSWDISWFEKRVKSNGPFDILIFYQIHNFWNGNLPVLNNILTMLNENGHCWITFLNSLARRSMEHFLPPTVASWNRLMNPIREASKTDYASWTSFLVRIKAQLDNVWGLLDQDAFALCQEGKLPSSESPLVWEKDGLKLNVKTIADAYLWGASFIGLNFHFNKDKDPTSATTSGTPKFSGTSYNAHLFQALLNSYPETSSPNGEDFVTQLEVEAWKQHPDQKLNPLGGFLIRQIENPDEIKKVLVVGAGWGKDLIMFRKSKPEWEFTGIENSLFKIEISKNLAVDPSLEIQHLNPEEALSFQDAEFDVTFTLGYFSTIYYTLAKILSKELLRITKGSIYHLEDSRGPDFSLRLIQYSLKSIYKELGLESTNQSVQIDEKETGLYLLKVLR